MVFLGVLAVTQTVQSAPYAGCGLGLASEQWHSSDWTDKAGDSYGFAECSLNHLPAIQQSGFFLSLPSLHWQQSIDSDLSHGGKDVNAQKGQLDWSMLRVGEMLFGVYAAMEKGQQRHAISQPMTVDQVTFAAQSEVLLKQDQYSVGLFLDARYSDSAVTYARMFYQKHRLPLAMSPEQGTLLLYADAEFTSWNLNITRKPLLLGGHWHWSLTLGYGELDDREGNYVLNDHLNDRDLIHLQATLGWQWRYRLTPRVHPYFNAEMRGQYWHTSDNQNVQTHVLDSFKAIDYQLSAGLDWRF